MTGIEDALGRVKPAVRAMGAYTLRPYEPRIKLNQNESPFDVPDELKERIARLLVERPWNRYPPFVARELTDAASAFTGWPADGVLVGNGSNELIQALLAVSVGEGVSVVIPEPTFTLYRLMTTVNGGTVVSVPLDADLAFDVDAIIAAACAADAGVVVLCTPNNPTGSALGSADIVRIHDETAALVVVDQAYVEFGGADAIPLLRDRPRMVVLRTFSKAMSMAGLRAGYLLADPVLAAEIAKAKLPYNMNFLTEVAAAALLREPSLLAPSIAAIREQRDALVAGLRRIDALHVFDTAANFVLFRVEPGAPVTHRTLFDRLLREHGILVRDVSAYPMLENCLRVNAGTPEETAAFLQAAAEILNAAPTAIAAPHTTTP